MGDLLEEFYSANALLAVCVCCTESETPDVEALNEVLFGLSNRYKSLYEQIKGSVHLNGGKHNARN